MRSILAGLSPVCIVIAILFTIASCGGSSTSTTFDPGLSEVKAYGDILNDVPGHPGERLEVEARRTETGDGHGTQVGGDIQVPSNQTGVVFSARTWAYFKYVTPSKQQLDTHSVSGFPLVRYSLTLEGYPPIISWSNGGPDAALEAMASQYPKNTWIPYEFRVWTPAEAMGRIGAQLAGWEIKPGTFTVTRTEDDGLGLLAVGGAFGFLIGAMQATAVAVCPMWRTQGRIMFEGEGVVPPPPSTTLSANGPSSAVAGATVTINVASNCPIGWTATWTGGNHSGQGNGSFTVLMPNADLVVHVTDGCGNTATVTVQLITNPPVNQLPVAKVAATPESGQAPLATSSDASESYDPDGTIVKYEWAFDGGAYVVGNATMEHTFAVVGNHTITVRVTDNSGATAVASDSVTVAAPPADDYAGASAIITPEDPFADPFVGDELGLVARIVAANGTTLLAFPTGSMTTWSSDPDGFVQVDAGRMDKATFFSALALDGDVLLFESVLVNVNTTWTGHSLSGSTTAYLVLKGGSMIDSLLGKKPEYRLIFVGN